MAEAVSTTRSSSPAPSSANAPRTPARAAASIPAALRNRAGPVHVLNKTFYRTRENRLIDLPEDLTFEEALSLEAEALAVETKVGKGPPPKPVPDVKQLVKKEPAKKGKAAAKGSRRAGAKGKAAAKAGAAAAGMLKAVGKSKVAQYLVSKAAPVLQKGFGNLSKLSQNEQTHDDAADKREQAEKAVVIPVSDGQSKSNAAQVDTVGSRPAPAVDEAQAKQQLTDSLSANVPRKVEDVDNFKRDQKAQHIGADVMKVVLQDKNAVVGTFQDIGHTPPPAPREHEPENLPPIEAAPPTSTLNLGKEAIAPLQKEHTDVSNFTKEADSKLKDEGVTQEQLDMVDSGDLATAKKEKKGMEVAAKTEPEAVQKFAKQEAEGVDKKLKQEETKQRQSMKTKRKAGLGTAAQKQRNTKSNLEKKREEVAAEINGMYTTAQDNVKKRLADLETTSMKRFDEGNARATKKFENDVNRELAAFKADRYSGWFGWARKLRDWWKGMDDLPAVKDIFERNRTSFVTSINQLVETITADNKRVIQECKDELQNARTRIADFVSKLGPSLIDIGKQAAAEMNSKLNEMDKFIAKKEEDLQNQLKDKQTAAIKAIDEKIEKMKEAMAGALAKLGKLLLWAAKKFFTWALQKFGYSLGEIEGIINKGAAVLKAIFTKPIQFVKNLMKAAVLGFENFGKNFLKHLQDALFEWLTGSLQGLVLPSTWDFKGILSVALQMIGISYQNIRKHLVTVIGNEKIVSEIEDKLVIVKTLITQGPMAAWEQLQEMAGEARDAFIDAVKSFIKRKIVEEAIKWVISLFIPGAGIVKAIIGIYDTVVFFIQKAKQIAQMIGSFLGSMGEIAAGNIGAAAAAMEKGLARGLSLVIGFLAQLLHLTGVTAKVREAMQNIKNKVDAVLLKVAKWIAEKARALIGKGVGAVKSGAAKVLQWWKARTKFTAEDGEHTLSIEGTPQKPFVQIASAPQSLRAYLKPRVAPSKWAEVEKLVDQVEKAASDIKAGEKPEAAQKRVQDKLEALKAALPKALQTDLPLTVVVHEPGDNLAMRVIAKPLTKRAGNTSPSEQTSSLEKHPTAATGQALMDQLNLGKKGGRGWVALHLLSFRLMGPNAWWNLAPGYQSANSAMAKIEADTEEMITKRGQKTYGGKPLSTAIRFYEVTTDYQKESDPPGTEQFAQRVVIKQGVYDPIAKKEWPDKAHPPIISAVPVLGKLPPPNYSTMGGQALNTLLGKKKHPKGSDKFPASIGEMIVKARGKMKEDAGTQEFSYERLRDYSSKIITDDDVEALIELVRKGKAEIK